MHEEHDPLIWLSERSHVLRPAMRPGHLATLFPLALLRPVGPFELGESLAEACGVHSSSLCSSTASAESLGILRRDGVEWDWVQPSEWTLDAPKFVETVKLPTSDARAFARAARRAKLRPSAVMVGLLLSDGPMTVAEIASTLCFHAKADDHVGNLIRAGFAEFDDAGRVCLI